MLGWLLITISLPRLPAALTSLLLTIQPVGSVALAALIFGESPSALQLVGVAIVLAALLAATSPGAAGAWLDGARCPSRRLRPIGTGPRPRAESAPPPRGRRPP